MKNKNYVPAARRRLDGKVIAQNHQNANNVLFEAALILSLFAVIMFFISLGLYLPYAHAASMSSVSDNPAGGPIDYDESEISSIKTTNLRRPSTVFRNGRDKTGGIQLAVFPVTGKMTDSYGRRSNPFGTGATEFHAGMDISAPKGTPVSAAADGVVVFSGRKGGYGNIVIIEHAGEEIATRYGHLSRLDVKEGDIIQAGSQIGLVGSTGRSTGPHLHYEVRIDGKAANPRAFHSLSQGF